ncbi:MAG TPA: cell wall-binding repeat-containing protein [Acidimicrobiales bacterium]|nr:cell wall-binding repeat-containing protein [Acidimicrobiales bacterium]
MSRRRTALGALVAAALVAGTGTAGATADATGNRLAGPDRFSTARVVAEQTFPDGATVALLASGRSFADALAASYLSGAGQLPLLLTEPHGLPADLTDTLRALNVEGVLVLGGTAAVNESVVDQLESEGFDVDRLAGDDRYETARRIAELLPQDAVGSFGAGRAAIVATGEAFPDALAAGPLSASQGMPILLTEGGALNAHAQAALESLDIEQVLIAGGPAAVSDAVVDAIEAMGIAVRRVAGASRQATAAALAEVARGELSYPTERVLLARGDSFADALAGGTRGGHLFAPILLISAAGTLGVDARSFISDNAGTIATVDALGGTAAVSDATLNDAVAAARGQ